ncbi:MAG: M48 family metallopeptidase [Gammaproteobacteria bacterium]|nr:M48 family metallopeptidase [Gammaproteobacteria bacterium]
MNFFEHQHRARQWTARLVLLFLAAVLLIVLAVNIGVGFAFSLYAATQDYGVTESASLLGAVSAHIYVFTTLATLGIIAAGTIKRLYDISAGGKAVAEMMGGRRVDRYTEVASERQLLNVVDEMAIASGIASPAVYIMDNQRSINAFAAGFSPNSAVIAVTSGTLESLTREELQGVIAHEFSHVLNGDMQINVRLLGILNGITYIGTGGKQLLRVRHPALVFIGMLLAVAGYTGVFFAHLIKSAVSRQREFLADASAVQFTRNPDGIASALSKIYLLPYMPAIRNRHSEEISHMFFSNVGSIASFDFMATHPPLEERIKRIKPGIRFEKLVRTKREKTEMLHKGLIEPSRINNVFLGMEDLGVDSGHILESVGNPSALHMAYAAALLETIPASVLKTLETGEGAQAVVYAMVIEQKHSQAQFNWLKENAYAELVKQVESVWQNIHKLDKRYRLPILDLALPILKALTQEQKNSLLNSVEALIKLDERITLEEYVVHAILRHQLSNKADKAPRIRHTHLAPVTPECVLLLSFLAYAGAGRGQDINKAFMKGAQVLQLKDAALLGKQFIKLGDLEDALSELRKLAFRPRRQLVGACAETVMANGYIHTREAELLRMIAEVLECPMPPIINGNH